MQLIANRRPRRLVKIALVAGLLALIVPAVLWSFLPDWPVPPGTGANARRTVEIAGDATRFDPVAGLDQAIALAGPGARLEGLRASGVRRDGTQDLTATYTPAPHATYSLYRDAPPPVPAPPLGAGGSADGRWYQSLIVQAYRPGQQRQVTSIGGGIGLRIRYTNRGLDLAEGAVSGEPRSDLPAPACPFVRLWDDAIAQGAPADAVAQISYDDRGYRFNIPGLFHRRYGMDCRPAR
jgi:hypothetical protein